jgi:hypothetical protein
MPDRRPRNRTPQFNSLVAAAEIMLAPNLAVRGSSTVSVHGWHHDAWDYYDTIGELRFGVNWIANAMSRVNLVAARPADSPGGDPIIINPDDAGLTPGQRRAAEIVAQIAGGQSGQGQMLLSFGIHLSVTGVAWLVAEPALDDPLSDRFDTWLVLSTEEIRETRDGRIEIRMGEKSWRDLHPNAIVVRVWRKHPRRSWEPDAPVRGVLAVLREIDLLNRHIHATATSRLAGAGILAIPSEAVFPPGQGPQLGQPVDPDDQNTTAPEDGFVDTLIDAMTTPLIDRGSAAAVVPLVVKVPGELVDKMKHLTFDTPFDDRVQSLMEQAIKRLALGLDIPPEILTGTSAMNHWGAWQVAEEAITLHIEPLSETVVHALTVGFLNAALTAEGYDPAEAMIWYDTADLRTKPDKTASAIEAYDRHELSADSLLREMGFSPEDAPTPEQRREAILLSVVRGSPTLAPGILMELGFMSAPQIAEGVSAVEDAKAPEAPPVVPAIIESAPDTQPDSVDQSALTASCDMIVRRALERAGSRLRSAAGKGQPGGAASVACPDPTALHTLFDATAHADFSSLLEGAWTLVPEIADRYGVDAEVLTSSLDTYTRALLAAKQEHRYGRLASALTPA